MPYHTFLRFLDMLVIVTLKFKQRDMKRQDCLTVVLLAWLYMYMLPL